MTRDEYLRKLREEFIDRHLALPGWMERLPPWLREYLCILYWVFFRPSALRLYLARLAQEAGMEETAGWKLLRLPSIRSLLLRGIALTLLLPLVMVRYLIQHRPELLVILSGHHTLQERMRRYWEPLMGIARPVRVSYLEEDAARRLITDPWDGFRLQYTEESIQRLMTATGRQPMLLQLACSAVIREVNNRMAREGYEAYPTARPEEVERALDRLLVEGETWYFDAVWDWLKEEQRDVLIRLAHAYQPGSEGWILWREVPGVKEETIRALEEREVLEVDGDRCRFRVELLRRWLARRSPPIPRS